MKKYIFPIVLSSLFLQPSSNALPSGDEPAVEASGEGVHSSVTRPVPEVEDLPPPLYERPLGWRGSLPILFVTTLFQPFTHLYYSATGEVGNEFCRDQLQKVEEDGVVSYSWDITKGVGQAIYEHPVDAVLLTGGMALGWTDVGEVAPLVPFAVNMVGGVRKGSSLVRLADSIKCDTVLRKGVKLGLYISAVTVMSAVPAAAAMEWESVADAHAYYSGGKCDLRVWGKDMDGGVQCLVDEKGIQECRELLPFDKVDGVDAQLFKRFASPNPDQDPVLVVTYGEGQKACLLTSTKPGTSAIKMCFEDMTDLGKRSVETASVSLARGHEGLPPGGQVEHFALRGGKGPLGSERGACGYFHEGKWTPRLGEKPVCMLSALEPGGDVHQVCLDPERLDSVVLTEAKGVKLSFESDGKPVSVLFEDPKAMGLNVDPVLPPSEEVPSQDEDVAWETVSGHPRPDPSQGKSISVQVEKEGVAEVPCQVEPQTVTLWGAMGAWWTGRWPCGDEGVDPSDGKGEL